MHAKTFKLEEKLVASDSSDFEKFKAFRKLAENMESEIHDLREWIRSEGERSDVCTFSIMGEVCSTCRCERKMS
jgi:hypothetical protein